MKSLTSFGAILFFQSSRKLVSDSFNGSQKGIFSKSFGLNFSDHGYEITRLVLDRFELIDEDTFQIHVKK